MASEISQQNSLKFSQFSFHLLIGESHGRHMAGCILLRSILGFSSGAVTEKILCSKALASGAAVNVGG